MHYLTKARILHTPYRTPKRVSNHIKNSNQTTTTMNHNLRIAERNGVFTIERRYQATLFGFNIGKAKWKKLNQFGLPATDLSIATGVNTPPIQFESLDEARQQVQKWQAKTRYFNP